MLQKKIALAIAMALSAPVHAADDSELAVIRKQIAQMKQSYEQRIAALEEKLSQAEGKTVAQRMATPAADEPSPPPRRSTNQPASSFNPEVSLILQGQYKSMKNLPERGISGFWPAAGHAHEGEVAEGSKRGFSIDHTELVMTANADPYWRGKAVVALQDGEVEIEEASFQSLGLGEGFGLTGGRFRSGIGYLNEQHRHQWDFADAPLMYQVMFGTHGSYRQDGAQLKWLAPASMFLELGAELGRGASFPGSDRNKNGSGAGAVFAHIGDDVGLSNSWRAGLSYLRTQPQEREAHFEDVGGLEAQGLFSGRSSTAIADFVWKWAPNGNPREQNFKFQAEYFRRSENGSLLCLDEEAVGNACAAAVRSGYRTRQSGWYAQGVYQLNADWRVGLRYDALDSGTRDFGANAANLVVDNYKPKRVSAMVDYSWSEFSRMRLQLARDESMLGITDNQLTLQYIMSLGAHGAHKF